MHDFRYLFIQIEINGFDNMNAVSGSMRKRTRGAHGLQALWSRLLMPDDEDMPQPRVHRRRKDLPDGHAACLAKADGRIRIFFIGLDAGGKTRGDVGVAFRTAGASRRIRRIGRTAGSSCRAIVTAAAVRRAGRTCSCPSLVPAAADGAVLPAAEGAADPVCTGTPPSTCAAVAGAESTAAVMMLRAWPCWQL